MFLQLRGRTDGVLAGDDIQGGGHAAGAALLDTLRDCGSDKAEHTQANCGGEDISLCDFIDDFIAVGQDTGHIGDGDILDLRIHDMDGVALVGFETVDDGFVHVGKDDVVACLAEQHADKAAADVACAELDCVLHVYHSFFCSTKGICETGKTTHRARRTSGGKAMPRRAPTAGFAVGCQGPALTHLSSFFIPILSKEWPGINETLSQFWA